MGITLDDRAKGDGRICKVMVVEDDLDLREALCGMLDDLGYTVVPAGNGRQALDLLHGGETPDLILLDLIMPEMDGYEFRALQLQDPDLCTIPVVVLTGDPGVLRHGEGLQHVACLPKPPKFFQLVATIRDSCGWMDQGGFPNFR